MLGMKSYGSSSGWIRRGAPVLSILVIAGTRPEVIKLAPVIRALATLRHVDVRVINSGQHTDAVRQTFAEFGLHADVDLIGIPAMPNLASAVSHLRQELAAVVAQSAPDVVIVQGDTLTAYAGALAAHDAGHRVAHVEAGLRTESASDPFPEEWFRRRIARVADVHFAPTQTAVRNLLQEGVAPAAVHCTGNTGIDSLKLVLDEIGGTDLARLDRERREVLVTLHRRENHDRNADVVCRALVRVAAQRPELRWTLPVHPNPRVAAPIRARLSHHPAFELVAPMPYRAFITHAARAALIISDSGGIQEEAAHLGTPLLVPRANTERPEGLATGFVRLVRTDEDALADAANAALDAPRRAPLPIDDRAPFGAGNAALFIARILQASLTTRRTA